MKYHGWLPAALAAVLLAGGCRFWNGPAEWPAESVREIAFQAGYPERLRVLPLSMDGDGLVPGEEKTIAYPYRELAGMLHSGNVELLLLPGDGRLLAVLPGDGASSLRVFRAEREASGFEAEDYAVTAPEAEEGYFAPCFRFWSAPGVYCPRLKPHRAPELTAENTLEVTLFPELRIDSGSFPGPEEFEKALDIHLRSGRYAQVTLGGELPEDPAALERLCRATDFYGSDLSYGEFRRCARCADTGAKR